MNILIDFCRGIYSRIIGVKEELLGPLLSRWDWLSPDGWCYLRMVLTIPIVFLYQAGSIKWSIALYIFALATDIIDGVHARATNQVTEAGARLDANADKVLIGVLLVFVGIGRLSGQVISMFLMVEGLLFFTANFLKPYLKERHEYPFIAGSNAFGKIKMTLQSVAVGIMLLNSFNPTMVNVCEVLMWLGVIFGIASFLRHLARMAEPVDPRKIIITVPNLITLSAIFLIIPAFFALLNEQWIRATVYWSWIFGSDWLDGWIARRYNKVTLFGTVLDPIRDNIARFAVVAWLFDSLDSQVVQLMIVALVVLEFSIGLICVFMAKRYKTVNLVNRWGKVRTVAHYILLTVPFFHAARVYTLASVWLVVVFSVMLVFSISALISYLGQRVNFVVEEIQKSSADDINRQE